jgi:hypothetical protein
VTLVPLLESTEDELARALLLSGRADMPSSAGLQDAALALGLSAPTAKALAAGLAAPHALSAVAPATATAATLAAPSAAGAAGTAASLGAASLATAGKFLVGGALMSFVAMTTLDHAIGPAAAPAVARVAARASTAPSAVPAPLTAPAPPRRTVVEPSAREDARPGSTASKHPRGQRSPLSAAPPPIAEMATRAAEPASPALSAPALSASPSASLAAEIRLLDRARAALARGDAEDARLSLEAYAARKPGGVLSQEADLLRVQLKLKLGQRHAAAELARRLIRQYPESTHVDSLRSLASEP